MPESEIGDLIVEVRSATAGVGTFTFKFDHMAELIGHTPPHRSAAKKGPRGEAVLKKGGRRTGDYPSFVSNHLVPTSYDERRRKPAVILWRETPVFTIRATGAVTAVPAAGKKGIRIRLPNRPMGPL